MAGREGRSIARGITQGEIEQLLILRQQAQEARVVAGKKEAELATEEERLKIMLQAGAPVERGRYFLTLETEPTGRSVAWRKIVEKELGKTFAEQLLAATPPGERPVLRVLREVKVDGALPISGSGPGRGAEGERGGDETT